MPAITPVIGYQMTVAIGNGATPTEVFAHPILINTSRGVTFAASTESDELVDTVNQALPATTVSRVSATSVKIDGAGMLHAADVKTYLDWIASGLPKNVKCTMGNAIVTVPMNLTNFQVSAERMKTAEVQITMEQAGAYTITASV
jgi:hypothetical protein